MTPPIGSWCRMVTWATRGQLLEGFAIIYAVAFVEIGNAEGEGGVEVTQGKSELSFGPAESEAAGGGLRTQ